MRNSVLEVARWSEQNMVSDGGAHDWFHIERVWGLANVIGSAEGAETTQVQLCAILHDLSDYKLNGGDDEKAAQMAEDLLTRLGFGDSMKTAVAGFLRASGYSRRAGQDRSSWSKEWKVVQDADYIDAIGAVGVARAFWFGGMRREALCSERQLLPISEWAHEIGGQKSTIAHFQKKLLSLRDMMLTKAGRQIAERRHARMTRFLEEFIEEWNVFHTLEV